MNASVLKAQLFAILLIIPMSINAHEFIDICQRELQLSSDATSTFNLLVEHSTESIKETLNLSIEAMYSGKYYDFKESYIKFAEEWKLQLEYAVIIIRTNLMIRECYERSHRDKHHQIT